MTRVNYSVRYPTTLKSFFFSYSLTAWLILGAISIGFGIISGTLSVLIGTAVGPAGPLTTLVAILCGACLTGYFCKYIGNLSTLRLIQDTLQGKKSAVSTLLRTLDEQCTRQREHNKPRDSPSRPTPSRNCLPLWPPSPDSSRTSAGPLPSSRNRWKTSDRLSSRNSAGRPPSDLRTVHRRITPPESHAPWRDPFSDVTARGSPTARTLGPHRDQAVRMPLTSTDGAPCSRNPRVPDYNPYDFHPYLPTPACSTSVDVDQRQDSQWEQLS